MCKIREYVVGCIDDHDVSELYRSIVTVTMREFVIGVLDDVVVELNDECMAAMKKKCSSSLIDEQYFLKCDLNDIKQELDRVKRIRSLIERMAIKGDTSVA